MSVRREVEAHFGPPWGGAAVLLMVVGGEPLRGPVPESIAHLVEEGRPVLVYLDPRGGLDGWSLPDERVGVRMDAERSRWGAAPETLDCQGRCQTLWHAVSGGNVAPDDGCLTCGSPVTAS